MIGATLKSAYGQVVIKTQNNTKILFFFTRTKTKEESNVDHIGNRFVFWGRIGLVGKEESVDYQSDWHGLDTDRRGVVLFKRLQLGLSMIINQFFSCSNLIVPYS